MSERACSCRYRFASEEEQIALNVNVEGWTPEALVRWLDRQARQPVVRQPDVRQSELIRWLRDLVPPARTDGSGQGRTRQDRTGQEFPPGPKTPAESP